MSRLYFKFRKNHFLNLFVINLRYLIGFGFLPSGMIKVMDKPFTRIENEGIFFDFLDVFHATGEFYQMVGIMQVAAAILLITQRFASLGAFIFLPIIFCISVLTLGTIGSLTPLIAVLMFSGIIFLLLWDYPEWINILNPDNKLAQIPDEKFPTHSKIHVFTGILLLIIPSIFALLKMPYMIVISIL